MVQHSNATALITGGSRGIGREIALELARKGFDIAICYRSGEEAAQLTASLVLETGREVMVLQGDVSQSADVDRMVSLMLERWGRIDVLVNNAGITRDNLLFSLQDQDILEVIQTNLIGTIFCTRAVVKPMLMRKQGRIINISSVAASKPGRGQSNYAAAKGGVEAFTRAMAVELAPKNIFVNTVSPGVIDTDMSQRIVEHGQEEIMNRLLIKRVGSPYDIARAVSFLADPSTSYITGEVIAINGGLKMA